MQVKKLPEKAVVFYILLFDMNINFHECVVVFVS